MNPHPNPPSETPWPRAPNPESFDTLPEGRYKWWGINQWKSRSSAPNGAHTRRAPIFVGLALIALAVVGLVLGWYVPITIVCAMLGVLYLAFGMAARP